MFQPPRCPYRHCVAHLNPEGTFCHFHGSYHPNCRPRPVPRFKCKHCKRTFSRQTFRADYRDHKPHNNTPLVELLTSGVGIRQSGRILNMTQQVTEHKARKISRHLRRLNLTHRGQLPERSVLQFDELETYETKRRERPVTFPVILETKSRFIIWGESAPLAPKGRMNESRRKAIEEDSALRGPRKNLSNMAVRRTLERAADMAKNLDEIVIQSDEKLTYPKLIVEAFPGKPIRHSRTNSKLVRTIRNPLFPINQTEAISRDLLGRLRRDSWLVSKKRRYLDTTFHLMVAWKNYVRTRFNGDQLTPAQIAGFAYKRFKVGDLLGWRQDWGKRSIPMGCRSESRVKLAH